MNPIPFRVAICVGGLLLVAAVMLFWTIILVPALDSLPHYAASTVMVFASGMLLIAFAPLVYRALGTSGETGATESRADAVQHPPGRVAKLLVGAILFEFAVIALLR